MRRLKRQLLPTAVLGVASMLVFAGLSAAAGPTIATSGLSWSPSTASVTTSETVTFKNASATPHGLSWTGGPSAPSCAGTIPTGPGGGTNWEGDCTFAQAGSYPFVCTVHASMTGTVTVTSSGPGPPVVTTEPATTVKDTEATLNGKVNPSSQSTTYFFNYGPTEAYGQETTHEPAGSGSATVSKFATVGGLTPATTYHFQMVAVNASSTVMGADRTFTTGGPPTATTGAASGVGSIEATLKGTVNPKGLSTEYFFNYGPTEAYGQETSKKGAGSGTSNVAASQLIGGLSPETTYHFQVVAKNSQGEVKGSDQSFVTGGGPIATTGEASGVTESAATLAGLVNPQGQQTSYHFNYGTTAGYGQKTAEKSAGKGIGNVGVSEQLAGLAPATTYHFQLVAQSGGGTDAGADQVFTTASVPAPPPPPPTIDPPPVIPPTTSGAAPDTKITLKPPAKTRDRTPTIKFSATGAGVNYQCSVDSKPFKACRSPFTAPSLKPGSHRIRVRAVAGGVADPTPASCSFKVIAGK